MSFWDRVTNFLALAPLQERVELSTALPDLDTQVAAIRDRTRPIGRRASIAEALSVPAIQRAVTLISHTVGSTSMQGWRNGSPMPETPIVLARPNPYETPYDHYRDVAFNRATRGETILWIANRDSDGYPLALVNVPPWEVQVQANPANRLRPTYYWGGPEKPGTIKGTRYSVANPEGAFVHIMYHRDASGLRGEGPLQMCGLAIGVAVEAMQWASNFYTSGGTPPIVVHSASELDVTVDPVSGLTEAQTFKRDWMAGNPNEPKIVDPNVESVEQFEFNTAGAQMLDGRNA
jgi:phage portal protein BeeE